MTVERTGEKTHIAIKNFRDFWGRYKKNTLGVIGLGSIVAFSTLALLASQISPYNPFGIQSEPLIPPSIAHPMGTDNLGRDVFSGFLHGGRVSLAVGLLAVLTSTLVGLLVGATAGYYGGILDIILMRFTEFFLILPAFLLALVLVALFEPSFLNVVLVIAVVSWPYTARVVRAEFLSLREREFVLAAIAEGRSNQSIIFEEILPNALAPVIINSSLLVAVAILMEAGLSFIGLGDPNLISWGYMIQNSVAFIRDAWWMTVFPGLAVILIALGFNLVAFGLNDALNPRLKES